MSNFATMNIYACGGAGINVARHFEKFRKTTNQADHADDKVFARTVPIYLDASDANVKNDPNIPSDFTFIIPEKKGSGKIRGENSDAIAESVLPILQKFKPADVSVVLSSTSGGSGSVIAPLLVNELISRGHPVIVIGIGSESSILELNNTSKTIKSYESISQRRKVPICMLFHTNNVPGGRKEVDEAVVQQITKLAALFSQCNRELDYKDLENWLYFNRVTSFQPKLCLMDFYNGEISNLKNGQVITVATLAPEGQNSSCGEDVEYQTVGYVSEEQNQKMHLTTSLHYVILDGLFTLIHAEIAERLKDFEEKKRARVIKNNILSSSDNVEDNGLVL